MNEITNEIIISNIKKYIYLIDSLNEFSESEFELFLLDILICYDESENCVISDFYNLYENILKITEKMKIYEKKVLLKLKFLCLIKNIEYLHNFYDDEKIINDFTQDVSLIIEKGGLL